MLPFINPPPLFKLHSILAEGLPNYLPGQVPNSFFQDIYAKPSSPHMPERHGRGNNEWPHRIEMSGIKIISKVPRVILSIHLTGPFHIFLSRNNRSLPPYGTTAPPAYRRERRCLGYCGIPYLGGWWVLKLEVVKLLLRPSLYWIIK